MTYRILTDIFLEKVAGILPEHEIMVDQGIAVADAAETGSLQMAAENFVIALDEHGCPGFLLICQFDEEQIPSAHFALSLIQDIPSDKFIPTAKVQLVEDGQEHEACYGPGVLIFIPGLDRFDPNIEKIYSHIWS